MLDFSERGWVVDERQVYVIDIIDVSAAWENVVIAGQAKQSIVRQGKDGLLRPLCSLAQTLRGMPADLSIPPAREPIQPSRLISNGSNSGRLP